MIFEAGLTQLRKVPFTHFTTSCYCFIHKEKLWPMENHSISLFFYFSISCSLPRWFLYQSPSPQKNEGKTAYQLPLLEPAKSRSFVRRIQHFFNLILIDLFEDLVFGLMLKIFQQKKRTSFMVHQPWNHYILFLSSWYWISLIL